MYDYLDNLKWHTFIWSAKTLLKTSKNVIFWTHISYTSFQTLECKFVTKKFNLIVLINASILWKIQDSNIIPQNLVIDHTKHLCHDIEQFYFICG
jgi:hypothetical protein